jgi:hypothetical protein
MLIRRRLPRDRSHAIEAKQAEFCTQPEITVRCLSNGEDQAFGKALTDLPRRVCVLTDVQRRIQRHCTRAPHQQHAGQQNA